MQHRNDQTHLALCLTTMVLLLAGCTSMPVSPSELKPSPERRADIHTQEAILPNTSYEQISQRMQEYSAKCLNIWRETSCGANCKTIVRYTPTIVMEKNKLILYLQKKGGVSHFGDMPINGVYLMMAEALTNKKTQQIVVHGFDSLQYGYTTQATIDWLSDRKKECPRL